MYGIPNMKLDKQDVVMRRIKLLEQEGVKFVCNADVGDNYEAQMMRRDFDAIVLCTGATRARDLPVEGRSLGGVHFAMDYLTTATQAVLGKGPKDAPIQAKGLDVVVIGGGDTGTDCVGTAMRQGCRTLTQFEIMPKPPTERAADNPWPEWPRVYKMDYGQEEAAAKFGKDPRAYLTTVKRFVGDDQGRVKELVTVDVRWEQDAQGRPVPVEQPSTERSQPAQLVLLAMGFTGPETGLPQDLGLALDERRNIRADTVSYATSVEGIFAAGDCRRGQSLVVWAIAEGRAAARECDRWLMGATDLP
jgi:glutamate synthase (NADPH/NADH) small chain